MLVRYLFLCCHCVSCVPAGCGIISSIPHSADRFCHNFFRKFLECTDNLNLVDLCGTVAFISHVSCFAIMRRDIYVTHTVFYASEL